MRRAPWTCVACVAAMLVWFSPAAQDALVYDRPRILAGEWWRLWTGHLVHFSPSHLGFDLLAFAVTAALVESRRIISRSLLFVVLPAGISVALLVFEPAMARYGGLSGLLTGAMMLVGLDFFQRGVRWERFTGAGVLLATAVKCAVEWGRAEPLFAVMPGSEVVAAPLSHVAGAVLAAAVYITRPQDRQWTMREWQPHA